MGLKRWGEEFEISVVKSVSEKVVLIYKVHKMVYLIMNGTAYWVDRRRQGLGSKFEFLVIAMKLSCFV